MGADKMTKLVAPRMSGYDFRSLCAELVQMFDKYDDESNVGGIRFDISGDAEHPINRARDALLASRQGSRPPRP